jgi:hypothetical protein
MNDLSFSEINFFPDRLFDMRIVCLPFRRRIITYFHKESLSTSSFFFARFTCRFAFAISKQPSQ